MPKMSPLLNPGAIERGDVSHSTLSRGGGSYYLPRGDQQLGNVGVSHAGCRTRRRITGITCRRASNPLAPTSDNLEQLHVDLPNFMFIAELPEGYSAGPSRRRRPVLYCVASSVPLASAHGRHLFRRCREAEFRSSIPAFDERIPCVFLKWAVAVDSASRPALLVLSANWRHT